MVIKPDDGQKDIFIHTGSLKEIRVDRLLPGQRVSAKVLFTERGREAREVRLIEDISEEDCEEEQMA